MAQTTKSNVVDSTQMHMRALRREGLSLAVIVPRVFVSRAASRTVRGKAGSFSLNGAKQITVQMCSLVFF